MSVDMTVLGFVLLLPISPPILILASEDPNVRLGLIIYGSSLFLCLSLSCLLLYICQRYVDCECTRDAVLLLRVRPSSSYPTIFHPPPPRMIVV